MPSLVETQEKGDARFCAQLLELVCDWSWEQNFELRFVVCGAPPFADANALIGRRLWDLPLVDVEPAQLEVLREALQAHRPFKDFVFGQRCPTGQLRYLSLSGLPAFDAQGVFLGYRGVGSDISGRKREEALLRLEHLVARLLAEADAALPAVKAVIQALCETEGWELGRFWELDAEAGVLRFGTAWNDPASSLAPHLPPPENVVFTPGTGMVGRVWQSGQPAWVSDLTQQQLVLPARLTPVLALHGACMFPVWAQGRIIGVLSFVSPRVREPDRRLLATFRMIGSQVGQFLQRQQAEAATRRARDVAEQATRMKSVFLANMSHEIRTPINGVMGLAHLLTRTALDARQGDFVTKIQHSSRHLLGLINDILDLSKIEAGQLEIEHVAFDLPQQLERAAELLQQRAAEKGLALSVAVDPGVPLELMGDPLRVSQILVNYGANAIKFTEAGRVEMRVDLLAQDDDGVTLRFAVADSGIGLSEEQIGRLFQSFQQADASTTRRFGGTGLGLAISKSLAEMMQGTVGVDSVPGQGSTFWFSARFARVSAHGETEAQTAAPDLSRLRGARILVVEDNDINQLVACELLRDAGLLPEVAEDGRVALARLAERPYDLVLMDMQMPVMDGVTATLSIRGERRFDTMPVIAMTANALSTDRDACLAAGMNDFVIKPFEPAALLDTLLRWIPAGPVGGAVWPA
ncbi:ATP-binding protein [Ramlibacter sp.]|uniref:hybrid sensor histidine kinase/response regulator n=1 Tax=Ramlibacter sp. TaxID=1917967 RepID=UPI00182D2DC4|nr:ATP-binding protein [Ramlibacter sp.]MBA2672445.1 response regulator [Ramlibacter sp.]